MKPTDSQVARTVAVIGMICTICPITRAGCWPDGHIERIARHVAAQGFDRAHRNMPELLVCDGSDFGLGVGGDYTGGIHRIRVPAWQAHTGNLVTVLAHELAHAEVALSNDDPVPGGHGRRFFEVLIRAGYIQEAERVAGYVDGGQRELNVAKLRTGKDAPLWRPAEPPAAFVTVCEWVAAPILLVLPGGSAWIQWRWQQQCRHVRQ